MYDSADNLSERELVNRIVIKVGRSLVNVSQTYMYWKLIFIIIINYITRPPTVIKIGIG